ncbi:hypothetical protein EPN95_04630 [Patescibacteria group bacterium]|nr:MAG: hypothetical protein EPN95_04630 [Patescibacteria group bacterium]
MPVTGSPQEWEQPLSKEAGRRRRSDHWKYKSVFWVHQLNATFLPSFLTIGQGITVPRRINREYRYQHYFFTSFKSIKTFAWNCRRPERYSSRPLDYYKYPSLFWNVKNVPNTAALLWMRSRPDQAIVSGSEKYRRSIYPSVFMLPKLVPNAGFASTELGEWTETDKQSTTWTRTQ